MIPRHPLILLSLIERLLDNARYRVRSLHKWFHFIAARVTSYAISIAASFLACTS